MSYDELLRAYSSEQGAVVLAVVLALALWVARRAGVTKDLSTSQEIATVLPAAVSYVLAGIHAGRELTEALVLGVLVFLAPMKWNTNPLPTEKR